MPLRLTPLACAVGLLAGAGAVCAQTPPLALEPSLVLKPLPRGDAARQLPLVLQAREISGQPEQQAVAEGEVEFRRGGVVVRADRLAYDFAKDLASAKGHVRVSRDGAVYSGPELELRVQRFEGFFLQPEFEFSRLSTGGRAARVDFLSSTRAVATDAEYTSCPREGSAEPAWVLRASSVKLDFDTHTGVADGAVLRFLGKPIIALPSLSFPLGDGRKSGWLPPSVNIDSRSGVELAVPYYWNIAPQRDATLVPRVITRRGLGLNAEFRYLEPKDEGSVALEWLPSDRLTGHSRHLLHWGHEGSLAWGANYRAEIVRVSDDDWWKDFPGSARSLTARLLPLRVSVEKPLLWAGAEGSAYARAVHWQLLQASDSPIVSPYQRSPQIGLGFAREQGLLNYAIEAEYNRFTLPHGAAARAGRAEGDRVHVVGQLSLPWRNPGWWLVPRLSFNTASYSLPGTLPGGAERAQRTIPSLSVDAGFEFERQTEAFGRSLHQTLEPRLLYVNTPYRAQSNLPNYDSAAKDFNFVSIYSGNNFSGVDRVSDAHQVTAGVTTRLVDAASGAEALRLGLVQRYLLRTQRVTAQADGTPDGPQLQQRFSDALLLGSSSVFPGWTLDAAVQYSPDLSRSVRSIVGVRYSPGPFRTVSTTYRFARGLTEQIELGWQWPIWSQVAPASAKGGGNGSCTGSWYAVGRVNYSLKDSRTTDSLLGLEYDAGCWIARIVAERLSTGRREATTRLLLQLELVGLSRLGSNPLKVLKDNIPGYRLLRDDRRSGAPTEDWQPTP